MHPRNGSDSASPACRLSQKGGRSPLLPDPVLPLGPAIGQTPSEEDSAPKPPRSLHYTRIGGERKS
jgi:hypothetical protein